MAQGTVEWSFLEGRVWQDQATKAIYQCSEVFRIGKKTRLKSKNK
jgi:hypothetical protein